MVFDKPYFFDFVLEFLLEMHRFSEDNHYGNRSEVCRLCRLFLSIIKIATHIYVNMSPWHCQTGLCTKWTNMSLSFMQN